MGVKLEETKRSTNNKGNIPNLDIMFVSFVSDVQLSCPCFFGIARPSTASIWLNPSLKLSKVMEITTCYHCPFWIPMGRTVYLPIHDWLIFMVNVGKYTVRPMDPMGL